MAESSKVVTKYNKAGEPRLNVVRAAWKASDFKPASVPKAKKLPAATPRPYLKLLGVPLRNYLNIRAETVPVDDKTGVVFIVTTKGGSRGATHVDSWSEIDIGPDQPTPGQGYRAIASARTPWNLWVKPTVNFEAAAAVLIARACGVKRTNRPYRAI